MDQDQIRSGILRILEPDMPLRTSHPKYLWQLLFEKVSSSRVDIYFLRHLDIPFWKCKKRVCWQCKWSSNKLLSSHQSNILKSLWQSNVTKLNSYVQVKWSKYLHKHINVYLCLPLSIIDKQWHFIIFENNPFK